MRTNKIGLLAAAVIFSITFFAIQASALESKIYDAAGSKIYAMQLEYDKGDISFKSIVVNNGFAPDRKIQPEVGYRAEVTSFKDEILYSFKFEIPLMIYLTPLPPDAEEESESQIIFDSVNFTLLIPYFENGKAINIYDANGAKKLSVDISRFSVGCGNEVCESGETYSNCPKDCSETPLQLKGTYEEYKYYIFAGIVLLLIISAFAVYKKRKKNE